MSFHHFISFYLISFHFIAFRFISFHFTSFHFISFSFISFHLISFHFISCCFFSFHFLACHFMSFVFASFRFVSSICRFICASYSIMPNWIRVGAQCDCCSYFSPVHVRFNFFLVDASSHFVSLLLHIMAISCSTHHGHLMEWHLSQSSSLAAALLEQLMIQNNGTQ